MTELVDTPDKLDALPIGSYGRDRDGFLFVKVQGTHHGGRGEWANYLFVEQHGTGWTMFDRGELLGLYHADHRPGGDFLPLTIIERGADS